MPRKNKNADDNTTTLRTTQCSEWSLNTDSTSGKDFWWNKNHSLSIWQENMKVPEPLGEATDESVWLAFMDFEHDTVFKQCPHCGGPDSNDDMFLCGDCGRATHMECSEAADDALIHARKANQKHARHLRHCFVCRKVDVQPPKVVATPDGARRALWRALKVANEYPADILAELKLLSREVDKVVVGSASDRAALQRLRELMQQHFQPHRSEKWMEKRPVASKGGGTGVYATVDIPRFTVVGVYPGYEDPCSGEQGNRGRPSPKYSLVDLNCANYFNDVFTELQLTFTPFFNEPCVVEESNTAWIQESFRPNGRLSVMTVRDIKAGEELMIGYGPLYPRPYPANYDAYAFHPVDGIAGPPCFALWHWTSTDEHDGKFVCYMGYDKDTDSYTYWETEDELKARTSGSK